MIDFYTFDVMASGVCFWEDTEMANFNIPYKTEREGQMEFFDNYGIPYIDDASVLVDNIDGVYNGNTNAC